MKRPKLWMLLVFIALLALPLGVTVNHYRAQEKVLAELRRLRADIEMKPGPLRLWWPQVVGVEAHGEEFSDKAMALLASLPDLQWLTLLGTRTTDDGMAHLIRLRSLEFIYLEDTEVTDAGLRHLARMSGLKVLVVGYGRITEGGLERLRRALPRLKIEQASLL